MATNTSLLVGCGVIAAMSIPLVLRIVPTNPFYGFRTPQTLSDPELWYRANRFLGWALLIASAASVVLLVAVPERSRVIPAYDLIAFAVPLVIAVAASFVYLRRIARSTSR